MFKKEGGTSKKTKEKSRIHHGIEIPCFLRQLINKTDFPLRRIPVITLMISLSMNGLIRFK